MRSNTFPSIPSPRGSPRLPSPRAIFIRAAPQIFSRRRGFVESASPATRGPARPFAGPERTVRPHQKRFGHIDAHPVKWLGLLPRLRAPLIISWYTKRHRQYGFLDHPRLCGLRAQDSVRLPERAAGKTSQSGFRGPVRNSPPLPFHYLTPPREKARKDSKPSGVIHMPTPIHKRKRSKKKTLRRLRDCSAFPPKTIIQGGTTKQSAANSSSRLTEGERLWRPEKIAAVAVAPSQRRLKVIFRTAVNASLIIALFSA